MSTITQPLKWHGGKSYLAKRLHALAPPVYHKTDAPNGYTHRNYVFAGGLGEMWGWECEGVSEAANDIDGDLVNFWRVLKLETWYRCFCRMLKATPFSQNSWESAGRTLQAPTHLSPETPIYRACAFFTLYRQSRQGLGKDYATPTKRTRRGMNENVSAWLSAVDGLPECHERLRRVEIRCMDAVAFIKKYDHERALFYCDPPYLHSTRVAKDAYANEMTETQHGALLDCLADIRGRFMLSGYRSDLYDATALCDGWRRVDIEIDNKASSAKTKPKKVESVWMNYHENGERT